MAKRQFKDEHGGTWDVWDVIPGEVLNRTPYDRRSPIRSDAAMGQSPPMLHAELEHGWLCFQTGQERRRFAPIPPGWFELPDGVLRVMLGVARPVALTKDPNSHPSAAE
jgi:hypothetical protein